MRTVGSKPTLCNTTNTVQLNSEYKHVGLHNKAPIMFYIYCICRLKMKS